MRPLLVNSMDRFGGAAIATHRLHRALRAAGVESTMLVQGKSGDDADVLGPEGFWGGLQARVRGRVDQLALRAYPRRGPGLFSPARLPDALPKRVAALDPDLVHLFWIAEGFVRPESLARLRKPLLWTLHDMWPFTGGCHYDGECGRYRQDCGSCPLLRSGREQDLSRRVWQRKHEAWRGLDLTVVATSRWLADCARSSTLFRDRRIEVLPNCVDETRYKPIDREAARRAWNLPLDRQLVLFSAMRATDDPRKGYQHLLPALRRFAADGGAGTTELVVLGANGPAAGEDFGLPVHWIGPQRDEIGQVLLYSAADVVVAPSVQENLSNTVLEALACGAPVVAFDIGGMPDLIGHQRNGYLARPFSADDLAAGIAWVLGDGQRHAGLRQQARADALARYAAATVAGQYRDLYRELLR